MKAVVRPRIELDHRTKLETVIPLDTPFIINVDPSDVCNFQCKYCVTGDRPLMKETPGRNHGPMSMSLFQKIVDDIGEFPKPIKVLRLYKDGEPLFNHRFADMVRYAKQKQVAERIDTTTNASLLTPELNLDIVDAGLDRINISIIGVNPEQYWDFSHYKVDYERLVANIRHLYEHKKQLEMIIKINGDILTGDEKKRFYKMFGNICDGIYVERIISCWPNYKMRDGVKANEEFGIYGQPIKEVAVCPYPFYSFSINSDGTASVCFLDWKRQLIIGDAKVQKVRDIWNGRYLLEYQKMFLMMKRKQHPVCYNCGQLSHGQPDDIDGFTRVLLQRLRKR